MVLLVGGGAATLVMQRQSEARLGREVESLRQRVAQLQEENESLSKASARSRWLRPPRLPVPAVEPSARTNAAPTEDAPSPHLYARLQEQVPKLTAEQVEAYLKANGRSASGLLAGYRASGDMALLNEAMERYPNDPQVAFEAVIRRDLSPKQARGWLDALKQAAPDNALANYLSAREYFKAGQTDLGVQELIAASGKPQFQDYTLARFQEDREACLAAGYSVGEASLGALSWLEVPQLAQCKQLAQETVALAKSYAQAGDQPSAQAVLQMTVTLGQRYGNGPANPVLIGQLVGAAIEKMALHELDPGSPYDGNGGTVQDRINQLAQQRATIRDLAKKSSAVLPTMSDQEIINYLNRRVLFGEVAAMQWAAGKQGAK